MRIPKRLTHSVAVLMLVGISNSILAQRPLCNQIPANDRERARAAALCRDPAPIIDIKPDARGSDAPVPPSAPSTAAALAVPNVVGQSFDEARSRLTAFTLQRSYRAAAEPGGTVLAQTPMGSATLPAGAAVTLVLSDGSLVRVPRVENLNINEARQRLQKELDLKPQPVVVTSDLRVGTVIEQQPGEGTLVKRGSVVRLQVSAGQEGPEVIDVPSVVGMSFDQAKSRLSRFSVQRVDRARTERSSAPEGQILEQTPRAASRAPAGSVITLTVSSMPRATVEIFEMPNVVGRAYTDAAGSLAEFKVSRSEITSAEAPGHIVAQTPAPGATLLPGDAVSLQISAGAAPTTAAVQAGAGANAPSANAAVVKPEASRGVFRGAVAIGAAVVLGVIFGALLMRQWILRQRAVAAADNAIVAMSPAPPVLTSVDILLEEETGAHTLEDEPWAPTLAPKTASAEPTASAPQENSEAPGEEKHPGS